jgi:hypothetical protein
VLRTAEKENGVIMKPGKCFFSCTAALEWQVGQRIKALLGTSGFVLFSRPLLSGMFCLVVMGVLVEGDMWFTALHCPQKILSVIQTASTFLEPDVLLHW